MSSGVLRPEVIDNYLLAERDKGKIAGPFPTPPLTNLHTGLATCIHLFSDKGLPLYLDKLGSPYPILTVLGIELDLLALQARLPKD